MRTLVAAGAMALGVATLPVTSAHAASPWIVGINASSTAVTAGHKVVFTGTVRPKAAAAGEKVLLQERFAPGKPWTFGLSDDSETAGQATIVASARTARPGSARPSASVSPRPVRPRGPRRR